MQVEQILEKLIKFNTVKDEQNSEIMQWLDEFLSSRGFKTKYTVNKKNNKKNLLATIGLDPVLTFAGHTDTVPAGINWTKGPFRVELAGDKIYGLGACDMKGGIAASLAMLDRVDLKDLKKGMSFLFTYDEECEFGGIKDFLAKEKLNSKFVIIGEPTDLVPVYATKGVIAVSIEFKGNACHGSEPEKGVNAIELGTGFLNEFKQYFDDVLVGEKKEIFEPGSATFNIAKISGGDAINKVPAKCVIEMECRTVEQGQIKEINQNINSIASKYNGVASVDFTAPAMLTDDKQFIVDIEEIVGQKSESRNYATEGSFLSEAGYQVVVLGPGPFNAHQKDEWVSLKSLNQLVGMYVNIVKKLDCY